MRSKNYIWNNNDSGAGYFVWRAHIRIETKIQEVEEWRLLTNRMNVTQKTCGIFSESVDILKESQQNKVAKIILKFEEWLIDQQDREDLIGDLAHVLSMQDLTTKPSKRKSDEHKKWTNIVIGIPEPGIIYIFNEAWQEFLLAKQLAKAVLE